MNLPPSLAALGAWRQFIVYSTAPSTTKPGRTEKFPINPISRSRTDAHDPANWLDFASAASAAERIGAGVGFVFTEADPFFFVDVDGCLDVSTGQWSAAAQQLCAWFAGAAVEVSHSGRGLHIIGTGRPPPHRTKCGQVFDLYSHNRFCALTFDRVAGDAATDHTGTLAQLVYAYLQPTHGATADGELTEEPVAEWRGPTDDADLLRRALQSKSVKSAFGTGASFADLWTRDVDALAKAFPPDAGGTDAYNGSSADMALFQHLAFWTGKHGTRMLALARQSALVRDKWEREDYLPRSISKACAMQTEVLKDKLPEPVAGPVAAAAPMTDGPMQRPVTGVTFLSPAQQADLFKGCVYVTDHHAVLVPGGELLPPERFRVRYGGYTFAMDVANERTSRNAWEAFTESQALRPPKADGICFRPMLPPGAIVAHTGRSLVNVWWPIEVPVVPGDPGPFLAHLAKVLPDRHDQTVLLSYMAACVQHKGVKFQWAPFLQGVEGNGKTIFSQCVAEALGRRYVHWPKASKLAKEFNAWMVRKLFYGVEDVYTPSGRADTFEELKVMITGGDGLEIEAKGVDQTSADVCGNFILNSNHPDGVRKTRNDRRIAPLFCAQQSLADLHRDGMAGLYVSNLYDWLKAEGKYAGQTRGYAIVAWLLANYEIPAGYNPAVDCPRAPTTTSTERAIAASLGAIEQDVQEAIEQERPGFRKGWISSMALARLLDERGSKKLARNKRRELLVALGYDWHPGLDKGQVQSIVLPDGGRPTLFVHASNPARALTTPAEIARAYSMAQE